MSDVGPVVDRLIVITGVTGTDIRKFLDEARHLSGILGSSECIQKFEDIIEDTVLGPCGEITQVIKLLQISRPQAVRIFKQAVDRVRRILRDHECRHAILGVHLTYLSGGTVVHNPVLRDILELARDVRIVHVSEDWYDIIYTIASRLKLRRGDPCTPSYSPYKISPNLVLHWRGVDMDVANMIEDLGWGKSYQYAAKHSRENTRRFLEHLLTDKYKTAYISHPITTIRSLYTKLKCEYSKCKVLDSEFSIGDIPFVKMIDAVKHVFMKERIIVFDPTTIDELVKDTVKIRVKEKEQSSCGQFAYVYVNNMNRWPIRPDVVRGEQFYNRRDNIEDSVVLVSPRESYVLTMLKEHFVKNGGWDGNNAAHPIIEYIKDMIVNQIEIRDYKYVEQSSFLVVAAVAIYKLEKRGDKWNLSVWLMESQGSDREMQRALALSKPIYYYILPINIEVVIDKISSKVRVCEDRKEDLREKIRELMKSVIGNSEPCRKEVGTSPPGPNTIADYIGECAISRGSAPFNKIPEAAKIIVMKPIHTGQDLASIEKMYDLSQAIVIKVIGYLLALAWATL